MLTIIRLQMLIVRNRMADNFGGIVISCFNEAWPGEDLEDVLLCPYCGSPERKLAYTDVQDWSFQSAPGKWSYWDCHKCDSLYLNPRPTERTIGIAYKNYYTQKLNNANDIYGAIRGRLKNEWISCFLGIAVTPRLYISCVIIRFFAFIMKKNSLPFGWAELKNGNKGNFLDFGCGSGFHLYLAQKLGWNSMGIDADPLAVESARKRKVKVIQGSFQALRNYQKYFDFVMCSHILEHMYYPLEFLGAVANSIRDDGVLILSLPNSTSALRKYFGSDWRGLEAPRHISIPSQRELTNILLTLGFTVESHADTKLDTAVESFKIKRRSSTASFRDVISAKRLLVKPSPADNTNDFIKLVCIKRRQE